MPTNFRWVTLGKNLCTLKRVIVTLLTALVLVQTVGVLHRIAHAHSSHSDPTVDFVASNTISQDVIIGLQRIWGDHNNAVECQLFDQACPDLLHSPVWALPVVSGMPIWTAILLLEQFALFERFYAARGPPAALL